MAGNLLKTAMLPPRPRGRAGFSLAEMGFALAIVSVTVGLSLSAGKTVLDVADRSATRDRLETVRTALDFHRQKYGRYPCPASQVADFASAAYGVEIAGCNTTCPGGGELTCNSGAITGSVPFKGLGISDEATYDGWGGRISYTVTGSHTASSQYATGSLAVFDRNGNSVTNSTVLGKAIFVLASHGPDGNGAYNRKGALNAACASGALDQNNCDGDKNFLDTARNAGDTPAQRYDDFLRWKTQERVDTTYGDVV